VTGWIVAFIITVFGMVVVWRERTHFKNRLQKISDDFDKLVSGDQTAAREVDFADDSIGVGFAKIAQHIEEVRRVHSAEAANLQAILGSMAEGVMVIDSKHVIRMVNPSLIRILDLRSDPVNQTVLRALRDVHFEEIVSDTLDTGNPQNTEISLGSGKSPRHLALTATPMRDTSGEETVLLICHDVTRLKQLEDVRREFVANVSHELRTPLAIFQGYLENLLDNPTLPRAELAGILEILKKHSTRLNALVEDLLIIARLESRKERLNFELIEPRGLIDDVVADWKLRADKKEIRLTAVCDADTPEFEADAVRIEQVMNNLVENALKYTERGGAVCVRASASPFGIEFRIDDTGIGITPQDLPHIFERFYRADKARSREQGGTGLGLSIVKHITQLHGGSVHAESTYGKGTSIILRLPLVQPFDVPSGPQPGSEVEPEVNPAEK
jgi:two-component system, OmpR family, phosphate regulon sensor histidine kinase PhoR